MSYLKCGCSRPFSLANQPRLLHCGHTICTQCALGLSVLQGMSTVMVMKCPTCLMPTTVSGSERVGVNGPLYKHLSHPPPPLSKSCTAKTHEVGGDRDGDGASSTSLFAVCLEDHLFFCEGCAGEHHTAHPTHRISTLKNMAPQFKSGLVERFRRLAAQRAKLDRANLWVSQSQQALSEQLDYAVNSVHAEFEIVMAALQRRKSNLLTYLQSAAMEQQKMLELQRERLAHCSAVTNQLLFTTQTAIQGSSADVIQTSFELDSTLDAALNQLDQVVAIASTSANVRTAATVSSSVGSHGDPKANPLSVLGCTFDNSKTLLQSISSFGTTVAANRSRSATNANGNQNQNQQQHAQTKKTSSQQPSSSSPSNRKHIHASPSQDNGNVDPAVHVHDRPLPSNKEPSSSSSSLPTEAKDNAVVQTNQDDGPVLRVHGVEASSGDDWVSLLMEQVGPDHGSGPFDGVTNGGGKGVVGSFDFLYAAPPLPPGSAQPSGTVSKSSGTRANRQSVISSIKSQGEDITKSLSKASKTTNRASGILGQAMVFHAVKSGQAKANLKKVENPNLRDGLTEGAKEAFTNIRRVKGVKGGSTNSENASVEIHHRVGSGGEQPQVTQGASKQEPTGAESARSARKSIVVEGDLQRGKESLRKTTAGFTKEGAAVQHAKLMTSITNNRTETSSGGNPRLTKVTKPTEGLNESQKHAFAQVRKRKSEMGVIMHIPQGVLAQNPLGEQVEEEEWESFD